MRNEKCLVYGIVIFWQSGFMLEWCALSRTKLPPHYAPLVPYGQGGTKGALLTANPIATKGAEGTIFGL